MKKRKKKNNKDAFGREIYDYYKGKGGFELVENDRGYIDLSPGPGVYFAEYKDWPEFEKKAIRFAVGKILDVGCGAGRVALYLQEKGLDILGIDISELAIKVCKKRGVKKAKLMSVTELSRGVGIFDTIVMYGNNFGLFANRKRAKWLLRRFYNMTTDKACIIAQTLDPYDTKNHDHLEYHRFNRARGRMSGQIRLRVRYKKYVTDWFDYLLVSKDEMHEILDGTGWKAMSFIDSEGPLYIAIIEKE